MEDVTLTSLLADQVVRTPHAVALVDERTRWTYSELDARAEEIARGLVERGVGAERVVAVRIAPSPEAVAACLGVLKAGGAYLPIDPSYPAERVQFMLEDAAPVHVLTENELTWSGGYPKVPLPARSSAGNCAYVIYTSGSSGKPKGVVVTHGAVVNYLRWCLEAYPGVAGHVPLHSPLSFDLSVTALFAPLLSGGVLRIAPVETGSPDAPYTFLKATPSHVPLLTALPAGCSPTEQLVLGGESLPGAAVDAWRRRHPGVTVVNEYGPTETTVGCTEFRIEPGDEVPTGVLPLGLPVGGTRIHVLDEELRQVPEGVTGELCIAGPQVARGYLGRFALTAERFVPDPYGPHGSRMYRSGDLGRWNENGLLEFVGRADSQIKLRGYRIEPGEVEAALQDHPDVAQAAVTVAGGRLVGHVVPVEGAKPVPAMLRRWLARTLPAYLVPDEITVRGELPLTANGKLDRELL